MDLINGIFELFGVLFILLSVRRLLIDKMVQGISWLQTAYFTVWGLYNLIFYPSLGLWYSFIGGIAIVITNTIWLIMLIYYTKTHHYKDGRSMKKGRASI